MAFSPGDKRNTAKVAKDTSTSPLVVSNRFAALDTSDSGLGPQAIAPQVPEQVLVPTVPSQTHTDSLVPCTTSDRTPRYSKRWDVERARSESAARSQTCGRELDSLLKTSLSALSKRPGWTPQ
jgi:hypothetical protein